MKPNSLPTVYVTGGQGYFGQVLAHLLIVRGFDVRVVGRRHGADIKIDLLDLTSVMRLIRDYDPGVVVHCAASVPQTVDGYHSSKIAEDNLSMVRNIVAAKPRRVVFLSSMTVYDGEAAQPCHEAQTLSPLSEYARSKLESENYFLSGGIPGLSIRIPGLFGGGRASGLIYNALVAMQKGQAPSLPPEPLLWSAMNVSDAAEYIADLLNCRVDNFECVNVGYSGVSSINILVDLLSQHFQSSVSYNVQHPPFQFELNKFSLLTGNKPKSFRSALEEYFCDW